MECFALHNRDKVKHFDDKKLPELIKIKRNKLLVSWISKSWNHINNDMIQKSFEFCGYGIPEKINPGWKKFYNIM